MHRFMGRILAAGLFLFAGASHAQVVVSQVYGAGGNTGATFNRDFVELFNRGTTPVSLNGLTVQYASATGTGNFAVGATLPNVNLAPGQYHLVGMSSGANGAALPTVDTSGTSAMATAAGKVVLVNSTSALACNGGSTPCSGAQQALIVDLVGYGNANFFEGTAAAPTLSAILSAIRAGSGCTDTNQNGADFTAVLPAPRNSASPLQSCSGGGLPLLAVSDVSVFEGDSGTTTMIFGFGLNAPAGVGGVSIDFSTADGTATAGSDYVANSGTATIAEGATSTTVAITINGDTVSEANETLFLRATSATGATISDGEGLGTIQNDDVTVVAIHAIQGNGLTSPLNGAIVTTEGIVTAQKFNNGFFLQTTDAEADADPNTSQGIFVFTSTAPPATAAVGNRIRVTGTVTEFTPSTNLNQLSITEIVSVTSIQVLSSGNTLPAPVALTSADFNDTSTPGTAEKFEGMRVSATNAQATTGAEGFITESSATSSTTGVFHIVLSGVARPFREEGIDILDLFPIPGSKNPPRFDHNPERIMVRSRGQVGATAVAIDAETQIASLVGVMDYFSGAWAVLPDPTGGIVVSGGKTPAAVSTPGNADVTIGAFNLLRFFDEVNDSNGAPTLTAAALDKRLTKTSLAICDFLKTPDILGVVEVENLRVLGLLADRINATCASAPAYVPYLVQGNDQGGINVGFLVSNRSLGPTNRVEVLEVTQFGKNTVLNNPDSSTSLLNDRPPLMLRAVVHHQNGETYPVTVFVNHLRSLNGVGDAGPASGGWANENARVSTKRAQQAVFLANLVEARQAADPNEHIVLLGDFNAFEFNDGYADVMGIVSGAPAPESQVLTYLPSPITVPLVIGNSLIPNKANRYSYMFDGNLQTLDHVVVNEAAVMAAADMEVDHARINAEFGVHHFGTAGTALRVSDHDPVRVRITVPGFRSSDLSITAGASPANVAAGGIATFTANVTNAGPDEAAFPSVALVFDALVQVTVTAPAGWTCGAPVQASTTTVTCTTTSLANAGSAAFSAAVTAPSLPTASTLTMAAAVSSQTTDPANANNTASAQVSVAAVVVALPSADLSLRMVGGPFGFIRSGSTALFSVPVRNTGPNAVPQAVVTFTGNIALANANVIAPAGWTCPRNTTPTGFSIVCTFNASFGVGARQTFTFTGVAPSPLVQSSMSLSSSVSSAATTDPVPVNNTAVYSVNIVP
jgi:predicted extracellular nuclease